ncbi:MAG TPA: Gp37 family protein [Ancylobacter sp.]
MSNPITDIEDGMVARLKERLPRRIARIESFPDDPTKYDFPDRDAAACFVRYDRSGYSASGGGPREAYSPIRTLTFEVALLVRSLRGTNDGAIGSYDALEDIRRALQGQSFAGATAMVPVSDELQEQKASVWRWGFKFTCQIPAIAVADFGERPGLASSFQGAT